ncbi:ABC-type multidrug transport system fused ATPase/permease subunit [Bradyrhizobium sp. LM3.2]
MAQFPKKITDDPYAAAVLVRRLVTEQGVIYWRRYLVAFALMALAAGSTAGATYVLGQVINQAYVDKNIPGIAMFSGITVILLFIKGVATYGHMVILTKISNAILATNQRQLFAKLMRESVGILLRAAFVGVFGAADGRSKVHHRCPQHAGQRGRARPHDAARHDRRDGVAGPGDVVHRPRRGAAGDAGAAQAGQAHQGPRL